MLLVLAMRPETDRAAWTLRERILQRHLAPLQRADASPRSTGWRSAADLGPGRRGNLAGGARVACWDGPRATRSTSASCFGRCGTPARSCRRRGVGPSIPTVTVEVPETVERVVLARIDRLPPGDRDLLNSAAVIGREFDLPLLGRIAGADLSPASLSNLTRLGLFEGAVRGGVPVQPPADPGDRLHEHAAAWPGRAARAGRCRDRGTGRGRLGRASRRPGATSQCGRARGRRRQVPPVGRDRLAARRRPGRGAEPARPRRSRPRDRSTQRRGAPSSRSCTCCEGAPAGATATTPAVRKTSVRRSTGSGRSATGRSRCRHSTTSAG